MYPGSAAALMRAMHLEEGRAFLAARAAAGAITPGDLARPGVPDLYPFLVGLALVRPVLVAHGTPDQHARWLPKIETGEEVWCQLFSEPDAGSDLAALSTRAVRDGDDWRVTGQKVWSSRAHYSKWGLLLARTDPSVPKHKGITAFAIDMTAPGVEVRPLVQMNGDRHFSEVFLTDAPVPDEDRIGAVGEGWGVAITTLTHERGALGPGGGPGRRELLDLVGASGRGLDPLVRQRVADVVTRMHLGRLVQTHGSARKLFGSHTIKALAALAVDVQGLGGIGGEDEWLTLFLTAPSISIRGGTDEIQRNILGERVLGLPPEPRLDKSVPFSEVPRSPS